MRMLLDRISTGLHNRMQDAGVEAPSAAVIKYALSIIFNTVSASALALVVGIFTRSLADTAIVIVAFGSFRYVSGGYHLPSNVWCVVLSAAILATIPHIPVSQTVVYVLTIISLIVTLLYAPSNYDKYARMPERFYPLLKGIAALFVASNFLMGSELLAITYIIQAGLLLIEEVRAK